MFSITLKLMKKSARMLIPAGIAILIGTAFIAATFLFGNAMNDALAAQNTAQLGGANYVISPDGGKDLTDKDQDYIYTRTVNDFQLDRIRATEGVKDARASYAGSVTVTRGNKHASSYVITTAARTYAAAGHHHARRPAGGQQRDCPDQVRSRPAWRQGRGPCDRQLAGGAVCGQDRRFGR